MKLANRYQVLEPVAEGWSSTIYSCRWQRLDGSNVPVMLKQLKRHIIGQEPHISRPHLIEAMIREALALSSCNHPSVPDFVELLWVNGDPCIIMQTLPGKPLSHIVKVQGSLNWNTVKQIALHLLDILAYIHSIGWLHCDINPGNILLHQKEVYLLDFGAVQRLGIPPYWEWPLGRHRYMAPEHLLGRDENPRYARLGPASDLHQLACLLVYLLTCQEAFRRPLECEEYATDYLRALGQWMAQPVDKKLQLLAIEPRRADVPAGLDQVLAHALDPDPNQRFSSAAAMRAEIEALSI